MLISLYYCHCLWINLNNTIKSTINQLVRNTIAATHDELIAFISFSCHMNVVMHHLCMCHPGWVQLVQFTCLIIYLNTTIICTSLKPCLELHFVSASNIDALWHTSVGFVLNNPHCLREFSVAFRRPFVHPSFGPLPVSSASPSGHKLSSLCCPAFCTSQVTTTEVINRKHLSRTSILWLIQPPHTQVSIVQKICVFSTPTEQPVTWRTATAQTAFRTVPSKRCAAWCISLICMCECKFNQQRSYLHLFYNTQQALLLPIMQLGSLKCFRAACLKPKKGMLSLFFQPWMSIFLSFSAPNLMQFRRIHADCSI